MASKLYPPFFLHFLLFVNSLFYIYPEILQFINLKTFFMKQHYKFYVFVLLILGANTLIAQNVVPSLNAYFSGPFSASNAATASPVGWSWTLNATTDTSLEGAGAAGRMNAVNHQVQINLGATTPTEVTYYLNRNNDDNKTMLVEHSVNGSTWTTAATHTQATVPAGGAGNGTFYQTPIPSTAKFIRFRMTVRVNGRFEIDGITVIGSGTNPSCIPTYSDLCSSGDFINNFSTTGGSTNITNNGTGCNGQANNYIMYPSQVVTVTPGSSFNVSMQSGASWGQGYRIWVDWNGNGVFTDANEDAYNSGSSGTGVFNGTINVPAGTAAGPKVMRVRCGYNCVPTSAQSCGATCSTYGETEDYIVMVEALAVCSGTPNAGTATISTTSGCSGLPLTLSATGISVGTGISYQWQSGPSATGPWGNIAGGTTVPFNTTTVAGTTFYRLVTTCSNSGQSNNTANNISFTNTGGTACGGVCPIDIPTVPVTNQALACNAVAIPGALNATNVPAVCGGASNLYKGGQDAIYTFTPSVSGEYTISISGQTWTSIFVYSGSCPADGGTCVGSVGDANASKSLNVTLTAGTLYYIWFDVYPSPNSPCPGTFSIVPPCNVPADPGFGTNSWNVLGYNGRDVNLGGGTAYRGFYTQSDLSYNTATSWGELLSPSSAPGYNGCIVNVDNHTVVAKRTGVPTTGLYQVNVNYADDEYMILVNGSKIHETSYCCGSHIGVHSGIYDANTQFEMRHADGVGGSRHQISITPQTLTSNVVATNPLNCTTPSGSINFTNSSGAVEVPIFRSTFENTNGLTLFGNASVTSGALQLTSNVNTQFGTAILTNSANYNASSLRAAFDFRVFDGGGADGFSFNYAPSYPEANAYGSFENGIGNGLSVCFVTFTGAGGPFLRIRYNGSNVGADVPVTIRNGNLRQCVVTINQNNQITVSIAGGDVITNRALPDAFKNTDKTNWQFAFGARTGGTNDSHRIDNVYINALHLYEYSINNGNTWSTNPLFENLAVGTYQPVMRHLVYPGHPQSFATINIENPSVTNPNAGDDVTICSGGSTQLNGTASGPTTPTNSSTSATFTTGNISSQFVVGPTTATNSTCPGNLSVTIPAGAVITGVDVSYTFIAANGAWMSEQRSYLECISAGGIKEATLAAGPSQNTEGTAPYSRSNLNIANGVTGGGTINFRLHAFRTWQGAGDCNADYNYINNNSFTITVHYTYDAASPLSYSWSPTDGLSNPNIANPVANPGTTTTYTMTVAYLDCPSVQDQVVVTVNPPTLNGTLTACVGGTSDLSVTGESDWPSLPTGGTVTSIGNENIHVFTSSGTFNTPVALNGATVMVVGGGGGGGNARGGGGGAGGLVLNTNFNIAAGNTSATVGNGGAASTAGGNSVFGSITAIGGGRGGSHLNNDAGGNGGSGGGAAMNYNTNIFAGGTATAGQGFNGATSGNQGNDNPRNTGGGGGAGQAGTIGAGGNATWTTGTPPKGGDGIFVSQFSTVGGFPAGWYAGGGGGARGGTDRSGAGAGLGGNGGGGNGGGIGAQSNGVANTGGGGGGSEGTGATGGSGVVMIRYTRPLWVSSNPSIATVNELTGLVTAVSVGSTMITYYSPSGCVYESEFTVQDFPEISSHPQNTSFCTTGSNSFSVASPTVGALYQWQYFDGNDWINVTGIPEVTGETSNEMTITNPPLGFDGINVRAIVSTNSPGCSTSSSSAAIEILSNSTPPSITPISGTLCPSTNVVLNAAGGVSGSGSNIFWYTGPNGTGTPLGSGASINPTFNQTTTVYARREGTCNTTSDAQTTVNMKHFVYASNNTNTSNFCTDNQGWHHFFVGNEVIFSMEGFIDHLSPGFPQVTIFDNGTFFSETEGPATPADCSNNQQPGEERFEMRRSWNVNFGGPAIGSYNVRFYHSPIDVATIENAANAHMTFYSDCGYVSSGVTWFKNSGAPYSAPMYQGTTLNATPGTAPFGINYTELSGITDFSGGSAAIILSPNSVLPVSLTNFSAQCRNEKVQVQWTTASEFQASHYLLQNSRDGLNWVEIANIPAAGTTNQTSNYSYDDFNTGALTYYRLVQIDLDGKQAVYGPISSNCNSQNNIMRVHPNPTNDNFNVTIQTMEHFESAVIELVDMSGRVLERQTTNLEAGTTLLRFDAQDLHSGTYMIRVKGQNDKFTPIRVVKM